MKKVLLLLSLAVSVTVASAATTNVGAWTPVFKGIDQAAGSWTSNSAVQQVLCLRVDLTDPDVSLFTTPKCTNCSGYEVLCENTSYFLEEHGLQAAVNGANYESSSGPTDSAFGTPDNVYGLEISKGTVVSPNETGFLQVMLFTTNNQAIFLPTNSPATNTTGIYTAISGNRILLLRGTNANSPTPNDLDPRTAIGLSQDRRYLYLLTVDGRQAGWSDGTDFFTTGEWLKRFGAYDGINVDGGGSTTMSLANCVGQAVRQNRSSFVAAYGRERNIGHNFGVYAKPLPSDLLNLNVEPVRTTALITWHTTTPATTLVQYGLTTNYGSSTTLDSRLLKHHVVTLTNLTLGTNYYFRAISTATGLQLTQACQFTTTASLISTQIVALTNAWRYSTNNLDGTAWKTTNYNDSAWSNGPALLYVETSSMVTPRRTPLPTNSAGIYRTYYFRTHFNFSGNITGGSLLFSNFVDDGAVFYLNGAEAYRLRMAASPTVITNGSIATAASPGYPPYQGDAVTNDLFTLSGNILTNLVQGDNVLAVEVHNNGAISGAGVDIVFGSAIIQNTAPVIQPSLNFWTEYDFGTLFWNAEGFTLQQADALGSSTNWSAAPGAATASPYTVSNITTKFFRLKN